MKAGILTFHRAYNYGAVLQAFALQKAINKIGGDSEIIDYVSIEKRKNIALFHYNNKMGVKNNIIKFLKDFYRYGKNKEFDSFMKKNMKLSSNTYSTFEEMEELERKLLYDVYIVGSDQVWNTKNNLRDKTFLLSFVPEADKRCSYAASIGHTDFDEEMRKLYKREIEKFRILSVREESAIEEYDFLKENAAIPVLDPTLLLNYEDYDLIASPRIVNERYAFIYTIAEDKKLRDFAKAFCVNNGIKVIDSKKSKVFFRHSNPSDFLSFIKYADYVFTNSFHGTAFSIIMEKKFATEINTRRSVNTRSQDLMRKIGLIDRDIDFNNFDMKKEIDWKLVNERKADYQKESINCLRAIMKCDKNE